MINKKEFEKANQIYKSIEIPEELANIVDQEIHKHKYQEKVVYKYKKNWMKYSLISAAACFLFLITAVNSSEVFAKSMSEIPLIGKVVDILTVRSYEETTTENTLEVNIPAIDSNDEISRKVNQIIEEKIENYVQEAKERVLEYKEAFLATGGTEEEFEKHNIDIKVDYDVKYQGNDMVSFLLYGTESWNNANYVMEYYTVSLSKDKVLTLEDVLGEEYIRIANESIVKEMSQRMKENENYIYFDDEQGGFTTVKDTTKFYLNNKGEVVVVFDKYEVAPGFMGIQEFIIGNN